MRLSSLQRHILRTVILAGGRDKRNGFASFYGRQARVPKPHDQQGIITKSIERMIERGLVVGYGRRTPEKWFIEEVRITSFGRKIARTHLNQQQRLPLTKRNRK